MRSFLNIPMKRKRLKARR